MKDLIKSYATSNVFVIVGVVFLSAFLNYEDAEYASSMTLVRDLNDVYRAFFHCLLAA